MKIAVDAMGGDHAPVEVVKGALAVLRSDACCEIVLLGDEEILLELVRREGEMPSSLSIRHASERIEMHEHPLQAVRKKRDSSLVAAALMVKNHEADATFSAGNTGAVMAIAALEIGRVFGVDRPAIAATIPTLSGRCLLLDAGANVDCTAEHLRQFGLLGSVYVQHVWNVPSPKIGLLNIGSEAGKGDELTKTASRMMQDCIPGFIGNVEGRDIFEHAADVVVCDGFAGNVLLKTSEGTAEFLVTLMQREMAADPVLAESGRSVGTVLERLRSRIDYAEYGAAPLLGINGVSMIGHGRSHARAIETGIKAARDAANSGFLSAMREAL